MIPSKDGVYLLSVDRCIADPKVPALIRNLLMNIQDTGYVNTGEFFGQMSDADLNMLIGVVECMQEDYEGSEEDKEQAGLIMCLLGIALTLGEGVDITEYTADKSMQAATMLTLLESLYRKGFVEVERKNWSVIEDDLVLAHPKFM